MLQQKTQPQEEHIQQSLEVLDSVSHMEAVNEIQPRYLAEKYSHLSEGNKKAIEYQINLIARRSSRVKNNLVDYKIGDGVFMEALNPSEEESLTLKNALNEMSYLVYHPKEYDPESKEDGSPINFDARKKAAKQFVGLVAELIERAPEEEFVTALKQIQQKIH